MQKPSLRNAIAAIGRELGPDVLPAVYTLFANEQLAIAAQTPATERDLAYGSHERHKLDIYAPANATSTRLPILVFVHGGGFLRGDKGGASEQWQNANVGRMAANAGFLGVVMNYRLAPEHLWPAGGEDVAAVVDWLKANAHIYAGDPDNIILMGTSAGAVHVSTYLQLRPDTSDIRGAVLLSGLYGFTALDERDTLYYGPQEHYTERCPRAAITATTLPLLVACAEFDPQRFQAEFLGLLQSRLQHHGFTPRACIMSGHNHYSQAYHLGTTDTRLADEIVAFVNEHCNQA